MGEEFDFGSLDAGEGAFDISSLLGGNSGIDFGSLDAGPGAMDLSGLEGIDLSALVGGDSGIDLSGLDLGPEAFDIASLLGGNGREIDFSNIEGDFGQKLGIDTSGLDAGEGAFNIASLLGGNSAEDLAKTDWASLYNQGLSTDEITKREGLMESLSDKNQDFGGADVTKYLDEFNQNFNPAGGFGSQYQTVGTNRVMVNDDGTATILNPTTGESSFLTKEQTDALVSNGTLNTKGSGYVDATGGKGYVPGGGKTITNADGTKTVITGDGKVLKVDKDGTVTDTGKKVDVNDKRIETDTKTILKDVVTTKTPTTPKTPTGKKDNNNMLMALLALMAMMNKGGGGSKGAGSTIPSLQANRTQLPYGAISGSQARPGAGGVNYFSPTTYTQKAAGGGMMYGGGGISDLGGYSDGGRLLRGPGDGVSDSIPATIGGKQPARLAEGEFVVPARIVSELGNGSTEAGAKKLYAMMDRVQKARRKTKNVAADTKAQKYLPA